MPTISFDHALHDVESRFLMNLPETELIQSDRLLFWIEQAHWFYEDFYAENDETLPKLSFKKFTEAIFNHCPLFQGLGNNVDQCLSAFKEYKSKIPVCGCIVLNPAMNKLLLVRSWNSNSWTFPRGKINQNETSMACAIRETMEETGLDVSGKINENDVLKHKYKDGRTMHLYIVSNVAENYPFNTQTRKEISKIEFHPIKDLPDGCFSVHHFMKDLVRWIKNRVQVENIKSSIKIQTKQILKREKEKKHFDNRNPQTFQGEATSGWSVDQMFAANRQLTGKDFVYDGSPHHFGSLHPRYVDYNSQSAAPKLKVLNNLAVGDLAEFSMQSNDFDIKRRDGDNVVKDPHVCTYEKVEITTPQPDSLKPPGVLSYAAVVQPSPVPSVSTELSVASASKKSKKKKSAAATAASAAATSTPITILSRSATSTPIVILSRPSTPAHSSASPASASSIASASSVASAAAGSEFSFLPINFKFDVDAIMRAVDLHLAPMAK